MSRKLSDLAISDWRQNDLLGTTSPIMLHHDDPRGYLYFSSGYKNGPAFFKGWVGHFMVL